uniref:Peptidoglycan-recognition protein n=1 Tax=Strigamia maritima TaxID=126957 RepID=T1J1Y3_STRMM
MKYLFQFLLCTSIIHLNYAGSCDEFESVTRHQWKSKVFRPRAQMVLAAENVFIHHSKEKTCWNLEECSERARLLEYRHIKLYRFLDFGYNFMIGGDGRVYEGRGWKRFGAHTTGFNYDIGILFLGNFDDYRPPKRMIETAKSLLECGRERGVLQPGYSVYGHRDVGCTSCPGRYLYSEITRWRQYARAKYLAINCYAQYRIY